MEAHIRIGLQESSCGSSDEACEVQDNAPSICRNEHLSKVRQTCQRLLGTNFTAVYSYLKSVRTAGATCSEMDITKNLQLIVGSQTSLNACFQVDYLIFQELLVEGI